MRSRVMLLAAAASVLVHAAFLMSPDWRMNSDEPVAPDMPLTAHLLAAPSEKPVHRKHAVRVKVPAPPPIANAPVASLGAPEPAPQPEVPAEAPTLTPSEPVQTSAPEPVLAQESAPAPAPDLSAWAEQGRVRYAASYWGLTVSAEQNWSHDAEHFAASLRGSVVIRGELLKQASSGHIAGGVPVSENFSEVFNKSSYETRFDPASGMLQQTRRGDPREVPVNGQALDMLALMHFMALQANDAPPFDINVVTFRGSVSRVTVVQQPAHDIELPAGTVRARQFHAEAREGKLKIDIWLALDWNNAPVRIRVEDERDTYDLKADQVEIGGKLLARKIEQPSGE